jgi:hypothetical protein
VINLKKFRIFAEFIVTKEIGVFEAESEEEVLNEKNTKINDAISNEAWDLGVDDPDNVWAEEIEE